MLDIVQQYIQKYFLFLENDTIILELYNFSMQDIMQQYNPNNLTLLGHDTIIMEELFHNMQTSLIQ